jgi:hypothetical protein
LNSLVFKRVLELRNGVWVKTLRRVVLRSTKLLSRVVWTTRELTACTLDSRLGLAQSSGPRRTTSQTLNSTRNSTLTGLKNLPNTLAHVLKRI